MAFFTTDFLADRRAELLRSLCRFQYCINGTWKDGEINSREIQNTDVVIFVNVPSSGSADTITGVRVYDANDALAGQQSINLTRTGLNSALLKFVFPLTEAT